MLARFGPVLVNHHRARQDMLLWREQTTAAARLNPLVGTAYGHLAAARIALIQNKSSGLGKLIKAVPKNLRSEPGLAFARFKWRLRNKQFDGAIELLREISTSKKALGRPQAWANDRRRLARDLMRDGKAQAAYEVASAHFLTEGEDYNDLEWLSGFIALSDLNDPQKALVHFRRFRANVATPISLGRAGYWEGRALEALGDQEGAQLAYAFAGEYQTSFYGQLAAEKAGMEMDPALLGQEKYPDIRKIHAGQSSVLRAAILFHEAGHPLLFTRFARQLAEILTPQEQGALAQLALDLNENYAALYLAKYAAKSGDVLVRPYFPTPDIVHPGMSVPPELTLAIARRESEFYPVSVSPVGARGLMQLMPGTAKDMAKVLNVSFELGRLTSDPEYNARLGSAYLGKLMQDFDGYLPFVAIGYNAGPSRVKRWRTLFGDPRRSPEAAVDWIEQIPFRETRNYVMRVMESLTVYRARLSGKTAPLRLSRELVGTR
jgi:soluble lytic murein transglycosylase